MGLTDGGLHKKFGNILLVGVSRLDEVHPDLDAWTLLHAGPPFDGAEIPIAVRTATVHALMYEGHASTPDEAVALIEDGKVHFQPAQDWGVVTPLAQVVSASMPVFVVGDGVDHFYAPIVEGAPVGIRFGSPEAECLENLRRHAGFAQTELDVRLKTHPVDVAIIIEKALAQGNECHSLTDRANAALLVQLNGLSPKYRTLLENSSGFVLPVLMAVCGWWLRFGAGAADDSQRVIAAGGNGFQFGIRMSGQSCWATVPAQPPVGIHMPHQDGRSVLGAIGDSAVIDFCGLGGQALSYADSLVADWLSLLPPDWHSRPHSVLSPETGVVCPRRVIERQQVPIINLALVGADAPSGLLGKGFYQPDLDLFRIAQPGEAA